MLNDPAKEAETDPVEIRCYFVRERNALAVRGEFSRLYTDYYLHLMQHGIRYEAESDELLKDALAALALHLASKPWSEATAWTLSWQDPLLNLFATGSNRQGCLTGRIFTEDVRVRDRNLFFSHTTCDGRDARRSAVEVSRLDMFAIAEHYCRQGDQCPGRYFRHGAEDFVFVSAQPDCDLAWLESLDDEAIRELDRRETLSLLERRLYRFHCGCSAERIFPIIADMPGETVDSIFAGGEVIPAGCPRCGARYTVTREALEAYMAERE